MYDYRCAYCGIAPEKLHIDHVIPVVMGGSSQISNLMPACISCNNYKSSMTVKEFRTNIEQQVERARTQSVNFRLAERFGLISIIRKSIIFLFEIEPQQP